MPARRTHPYDDWVDLYDQVYSYLAHDISFYIQQSMASGGPVLELGCGTGRVAIPIAEAGIEIVGIDSSQAMLDVARRSAASERLERRVRDGATGA